MLLADPGAEDRLDPNSIAYPQSYIKRRHNKNIVFIMNNSRDVDWCCDILLNEMGYSFRQYSNLVFLGHCTWTLIDYWQLVGMAGLLDAFLYLHYITLFRCIERFWIFPRLTCISLVAMPLNCQMKRASRKQTIIGFFKRHSFPCLQFSCVWRLL